MNIILCIGLIAIALTMFYVGFGLSDMLMGVILQLLSLVSSFFAGFIL